MEENTLAGFRQLLETRLDVVMHGGNGSALKTTVHGPIDPMDSVDMASHHRDQDLVNMLCYRSQKLVSEIRSAIKRIDDGKFGTCWLCSSSIALERLRAHPTAILCVRCQGAIETLKRRYPVA